MPKHPVFKTFALIACVFVGHVFSSDGAGQASLPHASHAEPQAAPAQMGDEGKVPSVQLEFGAPRVVGMAMLRPGYVYDFDGEKYVRIGDAKDVKLRIFEGNPPIYRYKYEGRPCDELVVMLTINVNGKKQGGENADAQPFYLMNQRKK